MAQARLDLSLYVVIDPRFARGRSLVDVAREALEGGATAIQLRDKEGSDREVWQRAQELRRVCRDFGVPFLVNDRVDVAWAAGADGVHLGQDDLPGTVARKLLGERAIIGVSAGNLTELAHVLPDLPDYISVGPMFATATKGDAGEPVGPEMIRTIRAAAPGIPVIGIGGITVENAAAVLATGADGIAVISAIMGARDGRAAARQLREVVGAAKREVRR
jgi:thiamine-phosphate pyrophosphorylase